MPRKKIDLTPGVKYRGYGCINDFGEFEFVPEQTGSRKGQRSVLKIGNGFTVSETSNSILIHMNVQKNKDRVCVMREFLKLSNTVLSILKDYEI